LTHDNSRNTGDHSRNSTDDSHNCANDICANHLEFINSPATASKSRTIYFDDSCAHQRCNGVRY